MEKAKLILREAKKKKIVAELNFGEGKTMPFPQLNVTDMSLNGADVQVERDAGQIMLVKHGDENIFSKQSMRILNVAPIKYQKSAAPNQYHQQVRNFHKKKDQKQVTVINSGISQLQNKNVLQCNHLDNVHNPAYAPYNFVPLNQQIVEIPQSIPSFNKYDTNRNTGWIDLEIEAKTPLYIRGTLTQEEVISKIDTKNKPDFFAPAGKLRIPGSSLRGMIRSMVEIASFGHFHFFDDKKLYYRGLADRSSLREEYQSRMSSYDRSAKRTQYKFSVGIIRKSTSKKNTKGLQFEIISSGGNFKQIFKSEAREKIESSGEIYKPFNYYKVDAGFIVVSGDMSNKKRDWQIYDPPANAVIIPIPEKDVYDYLNDTTRNEKVPNLIEKARQSQSIEGDVPCFYVRWQDESGEERVSFGHTGMFRLAYEKTIGDHVIGVLKDKEKIDFAEALFGNEKTFTGRVFFEDAFLVDPQNKLEFKSGTPKILSTPKPSTFQHYLVQSKEEVRQLNHYNGNAAIRGYKVYWHQSGEHWEETDKKAIETHGTQYTKIKPVKSGTKFRGKIRFENLSNEELGALLFALELPEGCAHKIGMGKPLGLGSVCITPKLYLSNRTERYRDFILEWDNQIIQPKDGILGRLKQQFEQYVLNKFGKYTNKRLWELERLKELLVMLHVDTGRELEITNRTRYMAIEGQNEFKNRPVLCKPTWSIPSKNIDKIIAKVLNTEIKSEKSVNYIREVVISGLWGSDKVLTWDVDPKVNILVGINGSGKTTILELVYHALEGIYQEVRYAPNEFILTFDQNCSSKYLRRNLNTIVNYRIPAEFISTFDKEIIVSTEQEKIKEAVDRQLTEELYFRINILKNVRNTLLEGINLDPYICKLKEIIKDVFIKTGKSLEFVGEFIITNETLERLHNLDNTSEIDFEKFKELKRCFKLTDNWKNEFTNKWKNESEVKIKLGNIINDIEDIESKEYDTEYEIKKAIEEIFEQYEFNRKDDVFTQIKQTNVYKPDTDFFHLLKSKLNLDIAHWLCPVLLNHVEFISKNEIDDFLLLRLQDGQLLIPDFLSAGEKQILIILITVFILKLRSLSNNSQSCVLIMDEPEVSLHIEWQVNLIKWIQKLHDKIQIIIATHSPLIVNGLKKEQVGILGVDGHIYHPEDDLIGMGISGLLTSDVYRFRSELDSIAMSLLDEKRDLAIKPELTDEEKKRLIQINQEIEQMGFPTTYSDPLLKSFEEAMTQIEKEEELNVPILTPEQQERKRKLALQILKEFKSKEITS